MTTYTLAPQADSTDARTGEVTDRPVDSAMTGGAR